MLEDNVSTSTRMKSILLFTSAYHYLKDEWKQLAESKGYEIVVLKPKNQQEVLDVLEKNNVEIIVNTWPEARGMGGWPKEVIEKTKVKAIIHQGAGYDVVGDVHAWEKTGAQVANAPNAPGPSTANTAVFLTLAAMRKYNRLQTSLRAGQWVGNLKVVDSHDPQGQVVTIIGMGNIGRQIRDRLAPFGFERIQYYNRSRLSESDEKGAVYVDLETAWATSDVLIFACPYNKNTHHLFDAPQIAKCKDGVVVVNIARGGVIHEQCLVDGLASKKIGSAGLDVYEFEPKVHPDLVANDDVFLLPHAATHALETRQNSERELLENVKSVIETGNVITLVPELRSK